MAEKKKDKQTRKSSKKGKGAGLTVRDQASKPAKEPQRSALGVNARTLGTAILGAAVAEIAQVAIAKALESNRTSADQPSTSADFRNKIQTSLTDAASTLKDQAGNSLPMVQNTAESVAPLMQDAVEAVKAVLADLAPHTVDTLKTKAAEVTPVVSQKADGVKDAIADLAEAAVGKVKAATQRTKVKKKGKKS